MAEESIRFIAKKRDVRFAVRFTGDNQDQIAALSHVSERLTLDSGKPAMLISVLSLFGQIMGGGRYDVQLLTTDKWVVGHVDGKIYAVLDEIDDYVQVGGEK